MKSPIKRSVKTSPLLLMEEVTQMMGLIFCNFKAKPFLLFLNPCRFLFYLTLFLTLQSNKFASRILRYIACLTLQMVQSQQFPRTAQL